MKYFAIAVMFDKYGSPYDYNLRKGGFLDKERAINAINKKGGGRVSDQHGHIIAQIEPAPGGRRLSNGTFHPQVAV